MIFITINGKLIQYSINLDKEPIVIQTKITKICRNVHLTYFNYPYIVLASLDKNIICFYCKDGIFVFIILYLV